MFHSFILLLFIQINGITTQGENIADNGGVKVAYYAYNKYIERNGPESTLPGLKYNQKQLFWISFAQTWCEVLHDSYKTQSIMASAHATSEFRVKGVLSNMPEFSHDFNCPAGTQMNPEKRCGVWQFELDSNEREIF